MFAAFNRAISWPLELHPLAQLLYLWWPRSDFTREQSELSTKLNTLALFWFHYSRYPTKGKSFCPDRKITGQRPQTGNVLLKSSSTNAISPTAPSRTLVR
jgi:hypothetical protein